MSCVEKLKGDVKYSVSHKTKATQSKRNAKVNESNTKHKKDRNKWEFVSKQSCSVWYEASKIFLWDTCRYQPIVNMVII